MNPKQRPNHRRYLEILQTMTPDQKLQKLFELSDFANALFAEGLRRRFPELSELDFQKLLRARLEKCHNRNW